MDTLLSLIHDLLWLWVIGFLLSGGYFLWGMLNPPRPASPLSNNLNRPAGTRGHTNPRKPSDVKTDRVAPLTPKTPKPAAFGDKPTELMTASELTIKPAETKKSEDTFADSEDSTEGLFSGLGKTSGASDPSASGILRHKIARMDEIGFHHQIESDKVVPQVPAPADAVTADTKPADTPSAAAAPRSQTAELDDILRRIDKVLADGSTPTPAAGTAIIAPAPATAVTPVPATTEKPPTPAWARADVLDEDLEPKPTATAGEKPASSEKVVSSDQPAPSDEQQKLF